MWASFQSSQTEIRNFPSKLAKENTYIKYLMQKKKESFVWKNKAEESWTFIKFLKVSSSFRWAKRRKAGGLQK